MLRSPATPNAMYAEHEEMNETTGYRTTPIDATSASTRNRSARYPAASSG